MKDMIQLAIKSIKYRKATLFLSILSISLSVILLLGVERIRSEVRRSFTSTISGTDLIVGARSGNIPLLLSSIFHIGFPNQNVSWETFQNISNHKQVAWAIPLSLGDSHKGFSVVGTNDAFFEHYEFGKHQKISSQYGEACVHSMNCVLGAKAAQELGYRIGDDLVVTHGMGHEEFIKHDDKPFKVVGILHTTGTPVDHNIFVSIYAMGAIHAHFYGNDEQNYDVFAGLDIEMDEPHEHAHSHKSHQHEDANVKEPQSVSGFLLGLKSTTNILSVQRYLNEFKTEPLTAIMPVVTLLELWDIVKPIEKTLVIISILVLLVSLAGILTTMIISLNDRRREMAILRSVGAKPKHIFGLILLESFGIILSGIATGIFGLYVVLIVSKPLIAEKLGLVIHIGRFTLNDFFLLLVIAILGGLIGLIPAYKSYKTAMTDGLMVNK